MNSQAHTEHPAHDGAHGEHSHIQLYLMVTVALLVLTAMSYATYTPMWGALVGDSVAIKRIWMMGVSCTKAMLVITFFMHLKWEASWKWVLTVPASMMSLFLVLALVPDIGMRMRSASYDRLIYSAETPAKEPAPESAGQHDADH